MSESLKKVSDEITELEDTKIPQKAAVSSAIPDYESQKVVLSFESYNNNQCEIAKLDKKSAKHLTTELKKINKTLTKHFRHQSSSGIACKAVYNSAKYSVLFTDLPEDTEELLEVDYTKSGRIFGYLLHNIFNVVAIRTQHLK
ncbi:MAG: hypothetical protein HYT03_02665 [Candidatus Harrisonbacteria bacterium]|nr:hypothetical protein [Candidatus Harrisonbacteria bacterium]